MTNRNLSVLIFLLALPFFLNGQIPEGHFLDSDKKIKPFKQTKKEIYHYAILSELPFDNNCDMGLSENKRIDCAEENLSALILTDFKNESGYHGRAYVYLTVNKKAEIEDIDVSSYPESADLNRELEKRVKKLTIKNALYNGRLVKARLWTYLVFE